MNLKLTVISSYLILFISFAEAYTFYVETSEYSETVSVIENVVKADKNVKGLTKDNEEDGIYIDKISVKNQNIISNQESDFARTTNNNFCSDISIKSKEILTKNHINKLLQNGLSEDSIFQAKEFWNDQGIKGAMNRCGKISYKLLLDRAELLNDIVTNTHYENFIDKSKYPKIKFINLSNKDKSLDKKEEYLKAVSKEISDLRDHLLNQSKGSIVIDFYFQNILNKGNSLNSKELSHKEKKFFSEYFSNKINSKIRNVQTLNENIYNINKNDDSFIGENNFAKFVADVTPILEFYAVTMSPKEKENIFLKSYPSKLNYKKPSILFELAESFNKL